MKLPVAAMGGRYKKTRYGWEPVQDWGASPVLLDPQAEAQQVILGLVTETVTCGCSPKRAARYWDYILRKYRK